jgi:hypothetical protein
MRPAILPPAALPHTGVSQEPDCHWFLRIQRGNTQELLWGAPCLMQRQPEHCARLILQGATEPREAEALLADTTQELERISPRPW